MRPRSLVAASLASTVAACSSNPNSGPVAPPFAADVAEGGVDAPAFHPAVDGGTASPRDARAGADRTTPKDSGSGPVDTGAAPHDTGNVSHGGDAGDASACTGCFRNWTQFPAIAQFYGATELWVVSDIHADYQAARKLFTAGHILASSPPSASAAEWGAGTATFVVVGDMIDKGPDAPDVVTLLLTLQSSAAAAGGRVVVTMGNHEAEFLADPATSPAASGSDGLESQLVADGLGVDATVTGGDTIGRFLRELPIAARVDDWFFVHAGDTGGATIAALTSQIESGLDSSGFGADVLVGADSMLEARLSGSPPQWWDATGDATSLLKMWTGALGVKHLVMGHQPKAVGITGGGPDRAADEMAAEYGGLLFMVDTGMSVGADDTGGALLHVTGVGTASEAWEELLPDGSKKSL